MLLGTKIKMEFLYLSNSAHGYKYRRSSFEFFGELPLIGKSVVLKTTVGNHLGVRVSHSPLCICNLIGRVRCYERRCDVGSSPARCTKHPRCSVIGSTVECGSASPESYSGFGTMIIMVGGLRRHFKIHDNHLLM